MKTPWSKLLYQHYTATPEHVFARFRLGAMLFFIGLVIIYGAYQLLSESLLQEIITLIGLLVIASGFILAMMMQIRLLIGRFLRLFIEE